MNDETITTIVTNKKFDAVKNRWVVTYTENHHENNGKEEWDWSSSSEHYFDTDTEADAKHSECLSEKEKRDVQVLEVKAEKMKVELAKLEAISFLEAETVSLPISKEING